MYTIFDIKCIVSVYDINADMGMQSAENYLKQWTMFWQDYISIFLTTNDHYYWYRGEKKKGFFALAQKCLKKMLKCRLIVPSYEKNIIWD
jgi:hypothetical protein